MLSFIMPIYKPNMAVFKKGLKALAEQSLKDWELVAVLDGDDLDARNAINSALQGRQVKIVIQDHSGAQRARNRGFAESRGQYVVFWDCDCVIEPDTAKNWVEMMDKDPKIGFIYSGYKFLDEQGAINSEHFDPWMLKVANYISFCFPVRRELVKPLREELESLQDWDHWLTIVENGGVGTFLQGYAFSTAFPTPESISGKGCADDVWLSRKDKVKLLHNIPNKEVCVVSVSYKLDGIALAKLIDADYSDAPNFKPNHYKKIIQVGFSLHPEMAAGHSSLWLKDQEKIIFWVKEDVEEVFNGLSLRAIDEYAKRLNQACKQFVEDKAAQEIMARAGFKTEVLPMPMFNPAVPAIPKEPKFLIDASVDYNGVLAVIQKSLPDIPLRILDGAARIEDYTGVLFFYRDRISGPVAKRTLLGGRQLISNLQMPFAGYVNDRTSDERFIVSVVEKVRKLAKQGVNQKAVDFYNKSLVPTKLKEVLCSHS